MTSPPVTVENLNSKICELDTHKVFGADNFKYKLPIYPLKLSNFNIFI